MKKYLIPFLFCVTTVLLNSCKNGQSSSTVPAYYMTYKLEGIDQLIIGIPMAGVPAPSNAFSIAGNLSNHGYILIAIPDSQIGTYNISSPQSPDIAKTFYSINAISYNTDGSKENYFKCFEGVINITSLTLTLVAGTFKGTFNNPWGNPVVIRKITDGKFISRIYH